MTSATNRENPKRGVANRWYSICGFQFSRRQAIRGAIVMAVGILCLCVVFRIWYVPPRAVSRLIRSVGGSVRYRDEQGPSFNLARPFHRQMRMLGFTATDEEVQGVVLTDSQVTDAWLHHLKPLEELRQLHLHERQLGIGLADLEDLPELSNVAIWHFCSADLSHLRHLPNLTGVSLVMTACPDIDLSPLASLPKLEFLEFPSCTLSARHFEQIAQIKKLKTLNIASAKVDTDGRRAISHLTALPSLQYLYISDVTDETAAVLAGIESVTYLMIDRANLSDEGAALLAKLPKLHDLHLQQCVRPLDIDALRKRMQRCRINYNVQRSATR